MNAEELFYQDFTIPANQAVSDMLPLFRRAIIGIEMPSAWTAASLTCQVCDTGDAADLQNVFNTDDEEYSRAVAANQYHMVNPADFPAVQFLRLRSGTGAVPVNQAAQRVIRVWFRNV